MSSSSTENYRGNIVTNGGFDSSAYGWSLTGGAKYDSGTILVPSTGSAFKTIYQLLPIIPNRPYLVEYTLTVLSGAVTSSVLLGDVGVTHNTSSGLLSALLTPMSDGVIRISVETASSGSARLDDVSVKEFVQSSSFSTDMSVSSTSSSKMSSILSSQSSVVTKSSSSSSSFSSRSSSTSISSESSSSETSFSDSSKTTSGTEQTELSSQSSTMLNSSDSSGQRGYFDFPFKIEAIAESPVWCFERVGDAVYAGTGPNGVILKSTDLNVWKQWKTVQDNHIRCLKEYANGLWVGTEPNGYVYVYNFSTDSFYPYIKTPDHSVSSMAVYDGKLFIGTSPGGIIFSFDGTSWIKHKELYGGGVSSMFVLGEKLYISINSSETIVEYDGTSWEAIKASDQEVLDDLILKGDVSVEDGDARATIASLRNVSNEPISRSNVKFIDRTKLADINDAVAAGIIPDVESAEVSPTRPECGIKSINALGDNLIMGGRRGTLIQYDGEKFNTKHNNNESEIVSVSSGGFFCSENKLLYIEQEEEI